MSFLIPEHEVGAGAGQQLGGAVCQVDKLDPVTEGGGEDGPDQPVLHRQLFKHEGRPGLLAKRVHKENYPEGKHYQDCL